MKKLFLVGAAFAAMAAPAFATKTVNMVAVVDLNVATPAAVAGATYVPDGGVPGADRFLASTGRNTPVIYDMAGAEQGSLADTGVPRTAGLGFFAITAGLDGVIYSNDSSNLDVWKWDSFSDSAPFKVFDEPLATQRMGSVGGTGDNTVLAFTGNAPDGPVEFFSGSAPFSTSTRPNLLSKSGLAINSTGNVAYTVGEANRLIFKWVLTDGVWTRDTATWNPPAETGAGAMAFDSVNNILFSSPMRNPPTGGTTVAPLKIFAYDGIIGGAPIGELTFVNPLFGTPGYCGAVVVPNGLVGTGGVAARGPGNTVVLRKFTYNVVPESNVDTWSLY